MGIEDHQAQTSNGGPSHTGVKTGFKCRTAEIRMVKPLLAMGAFVRAAAGKRSLSEGRCGLINTFQRAHPGLFVNLITAYVQAGCSNRRSEANSEISVTMPSETATRKPRQPAVTPNEIAERLNAMARNLDRALDNGEPVGPDKLRRLTLRLRRYAMRLRKAPAKFSIY